jgi:hypothetical protein
MYRKYVMNETRSREVINSNSGVGEIASLLEMNVLASSTYPSNRIRKQINML